MVKKNEEDNNSLSIAEIIKLGSEKGYFKVQDNKVTYLAQNFTDDFNDEEEKVRVGLFYDLIEKYGYKNDNDVLKLEFNRIIGHPYKKNGSRLDLIIYRLDHTPYAIFELKSEKDYDRYFEDSIKTQLFERAANEDKASGNLKYLIYYTRYYEGNDLFEKFFTIDYNSFKTWEQWENAGKPNLRLIPLNYNIIDKPPQFIKSSSRRENQLRENVRKEELGRIADDLHDVLWGGGQHQNELFFNLIALFLTKIYDEKTKDIGEPYAFQIFYEGNEEESPESVYLRINNLYKGKKSTKTMKYSQCALNYLLNFSDEQLDKQRDIVFNANKVKYVVELLQDISFTSNKYDVLGDFFERIVRKELKQTKGQYLTHHNIVDFIVTALQIDELAIELLNGKNGRPCLPFIIDPSCGSGTFQIQCMKVITSRIIDEYKNGSSLRKSDDTIDAVERYFLQRNKNIWAKEFIYGIEINNDLAMATKVNMVGHGDGSANIFAADGLIDFTKYRNGKLVEIKKKNTVYDKYVNEQFDVVVSNPPFSVTVDRETAKQLPDLYLQGEKILGSLKKEAKKEVDTELLFLERYYHLLKPGGRLGVVLPESVFNVTSTLKIRMFLFKYFYIKGVVSLPYLAFAPYTMTKTSLLFAQKKTEEEVTTWIEKWDAYEKEYDIIKNTVNKLKKKKESDSVKPQFINALKEYLLSMYDDEDDILTLAELKEKYEEELKKVDSEWWIFCKLAKELNYPIFMAHAEEIGYKRGAKKTEDRPNDLFNSVVIDEQAVINVDVDDPQKILDHFIKNVVWK